MLTQRGWWLLFLSLAVLVLALATATTPLMLIGASLLAWLSLLWVAFQVQVSVAKKNLWVERTLLNDQGPSKSFWVDQSITVRIRLGTDGFLPTPFLWMSDRRPLLAESPQGAFAAQGVVKSSRPLELDYPLKCRSVGRLRFEGVKVAFSDLQGFFTAWTFVRDVKTYLVLPTLLQGRGVPTTHKRHNLLALIGSHRFGKPGSGSELLDLREYLPGDPPKMIAWKASARRDRLMTKEFESEVPIRCTLFVDASSSVRIGTPGENPLANAIGIAAGVVQASASLRDLSGVCLFDETGVLEMVRPNRGSQHVLAILRSLSLLADLAPRHSRIPCNTLIPLAFGLAEEIYPDLMNDNVNAFPWWLTWWSPQPAFTQRAELRRVDRWWQAPAVWLRNLPTRFRRSLWQQIAGRFSGRRRRLYRWRKKLAAMLAVRYDLGPTAVSRLLEDDDGMSEALQRFLNDHQTPYPTPLFDAAGRYSFASPAKAEVLSKALLQCVVRSRDNELFAILADLWDLGPKIEPVLHAVRLALAKHHQVVVICPWPKNAPMPGPAKSMIAEMPNPSMQWLLWQAAFQKLLHSYERLKKVFGSLGVQVVLAPEGETVAMILQRMHRLRQQARGWR